MEVTYIPTCGQERHVRYISEMETGQRFTLPPEKPEEPTKKDFPIETAFEQRKGNHTKLTNWSLVDDLNLKKKSANSPETFSYFCYIIPFRRNKKYFCDPCDMRFLTKVAHQTKHAAVVKEFEYPYASPLDELRAVDKAL